MIQEQKTLKYKGRIVFEKIRMSHFSRIPKFFHEDEACFMFINKGEFSVRTPDQFLSFKKGRGLLAKCFDYFFETTKKQNSKSDDVEVIGVLLFSEIVEELFEFDIARTNYHKQPNINQVEIDSLLNNFKEGINLLLDNPELADDNLIKTKLKEFVLLISKTQNAPSQLEFLSAMFKKNSSEFKSLIRNNLYSNLSIDEFAHLADMSVSSFKRKFTETFNESPKKYITKKKMQKSLELLKSKDNRVSTVAYDLGYDTISTFNRAFKKYYGKSPSAYRLD